MELIENLMAFIERKLFILNNSYAIIEYLGQQTRHQMIRGAILDTEVVM